MEKIVYEIIKKGLKNNHDNEYKKLVIKYAEKTENKEDAAKIMELIGINKTVVSTSSKKEKIEDLKILSEYIYFNDFIGEEYIDPINVESTTHFVKELKRVHREKKRIAKILINGRPGTGKTTYVEHICNRLNTSIYHVKASNLVSSYIGDTQKNIDILYEDILKIGKNGIIIIDEIDSLIGDRDKSINDEYKRMVGSFNLIFDRIPKGTILFAITNKINLIDESIIRRFNVVIDLNNLHIKNFLDLIQWKSKKENIDVDLKLIEKIVSEKFCNKNKLENEILTFSMVDDLLDQYIFFRKNIYYSLIEKVDKDFFRNEISIEAKLFEKDLNYVEIARILDIDQRTVKKKLSKE